MSQTNILLEAGTNEVEIVEFYIDEEGYRGHYGVNVAKVVEIIRMQPVTSLPHMAHPSVLGAFRHRDGKIVPLIDLAAYLNKIPAPQQEEPKLIVTEFNSVTTAFKVSGVNRIHRMSWEAVEAPGQFIQSVSDNSVTGVVHIDDRVVFLLDMEKIVGDMNKELSLTLEGKLVSTRAEGHTYKILHADDSGSIRNLVHTLLTESGRFTLVQFPNGQEAWEHLLQIKGQAEREGRPLDSYIDGVITDIEMPRMDGLSLCRSIKEDPALKQIPVALFSSLISDRLKHKGLSVGADAQFAKPDLYNISQKMLELIDTCQGTHANEAS